MLKCILRSFLIPMLGEHNELHKTIFKLFKFLSLRKIKTSIITKRDFEHRDEFLLSKCRVINEKMI